jgi:type II secretory pathway pseudopilin PulG
MGTRGFSATEMVVAIVGVTVLSAAAVPVLRAQLARVALNGAARQVATDLMRVRMRAVAENARYRLAFAGGHYQVEKDVGGDFEAVGAAIDVPDGVALAVDPDPVVVFRRSGWVDTDAPVAIALTNGLGDGKTVTISFGGRVAIVEDPT